MASATPKSGYSLWLSPTSTEPIFTDLILSLSKRCSPPTIPFAPHATLYADSLIPPHFTLEDIVKYTQQAVASLTSLERVVCRFDRVEQGALFFQCVYVRLLKQESEGLLDLHCALRKSFGSDDLTGTAYFPHMSLVYGNLEPEVKEGIIAGMKDKQEMTLTGAESAQEAVLGETQFETSEILVVTTAGRSDEWKVAARIPLGKRQQTLKHEDL